MADNMTPQQRSRTMSRIRSRNTKPELVVRRLVFARGLRYRLHSKGLPGRPDMVFARSRVVVFIDGDFWHGFDWPLLKPKLGDYWRDKIQGNIERDERHTEALQQMGWTVIRIWEHQVKQAPTACADLIESEITSKVRI